MNVVTSITEPSILYSSCLIHLLHKHDQKPTTTDYNKVKPYFGWVYADTIQKTFENTTQWQQHLLDF